MEKPQRREIKFANLDEAVADAERLAAGKTRTTGKHAFANILEHLALAHDVATGKLTAPPAPWYIKAMMIVMKPLMLRDKPLAPGIKLPKDGEAFFWPKTEINLQEALTHFKESVEYFQSNGPIDKHPFFGTVTPKQNEQINCRHCALHLSFVHPAED